MVNWMESQGQEILTDYAAPTSPNFKVPFTL